MPMKRKIPKYILKLLDKRNKAASDFISTTYHIDLWLEKNNISYEYVTEEGEKLESYISTGCISICEPQLAKEGFIRIIEEFFNNSK